MLRKPTAIITLLVLSVAVFLTFSVSYIYAQTTGEGKNLEKIQSYISQAQNDLVAGNQTEASIQLSLAISEISNILDSLPHIHTHTHQVTHSHSHHSGHHQEDYFQKHHIYDPSNCPPGLVC